MSRLIVKWRYIKPGTPKHGGRLVKYIATRDGVEKSDESWKAQPATIEQQRLIKELIAEFPESTESFEYRDYAANKTKYAATEFIGQTIEDNLDRVGKKENYVGYIAMRPRVEKQGAHGLFSQEDGPIDLAAVSKAVAEHSGVVWTTVLSLRREDAAKLDYDNAKAWKDLLRSQADNLAKAMGIPLGDLRWYAAFHNEGAHPHVHLVSYSTGREPYMTERGLMKWKSELARELFKQDLYRVYDEQTAHRDELRKLGRERAAEIVDRVKDGKYKNETAELLLNRLTEELKAYKGKKVYGYLPKRAKNLVNGIADELAKDERIAELYELWYRRKDELLNTYCDDKAERVPLSRNDEFKSVRNAVIRAAMNILSDYEPKDEPDGEISIPAAEPSEREEESLRPKEKKKMWELYRHAKKLLDRESDKYDPNRAVKLLAESARLSNTIAKYRLGKMYLRGEDIEKDILGALKWLSEAVKDGNQYAEYLLGKTFLKGEDFEQDAVRGKELLRRSAARGNRYAAYALGKELLDGDAFERDIPEAVKLLTESADKGFVPAQYLLGNLLYKGEAVPRDAAGALKYLECAAATVPAAAYLAGKIRMKEEAFKDMEKAVAHFEFVAEQGYGNAAYFAGKLRLTEDSVKDTVKAIDYLETAAGEGNAYAECLLGKLYLFGKEVPKDMDKATAYLTAAAEHGNAYAEQLLQNIKNNRDWSLGMNVSRLFYHICRTLQSRIEEGDKRKFTVSDKKLLRKIEEKKQAQGLRHD